MLVKNDLFNDRISRFSIRKLNVGVCSVLLGTLVMLGTATGVAADGTVTFVPEPSFTGTAPAVTVVREDMNGTKA